jgi:acetyl esterase/lipase
MVYASLAFSVFLLVSGLTALRPSHRGFLGVFSFPVGWPAAELAGQAAIVQTALVVFLAWWGWPAQHWAGDLFVVVAVVVVLINLTLVVISFYAPYVVRRALAANTQLVLTAPRRRDALFGTWWRTLLQISVHPRDMLYDPNLAYGPEARNRLDIWRDPSTPPNAPVMLFIHGGAWVFGDKREQGRPMLHELLRHGFVIVSMNYRLAPAAPWPAQIHDATRALAWVKEHISEYGGDPERVVVSGASAGGHLAALLALTSTTSTWRPSDLATERDLSTIGCVPFYGVLEMTGDDEAWNGNGRALRRWLETRVMHKNFADDPSLFLTASPMEHIHETAPPFLVVQGRNDTLVDFHVARTFVSEFRRRAFAPVHYIELPLTQHAFDVTASPRTSSTTGAVVAFCRAVTARPTLTPALAAAYQVPPTLLEIRAESGEWVSAQEAALTYGSFSVVTAHNPFSVEQSPEVNTQRETALLQQLARMGQSVFLSAGRDPSGHWPSEAGVAIVGWSKERSAALARAWGQFAYYDVSSTSVVVRLSSDSSVVN